MRFHLTMFFMVIAVSMGMHAMASAAPLDVPGLTAVVVQAPDGLACAQSCHGGH